MHGDQGVKDPLDRRFLNVAGLVLIAGCLALVSSYLVSLGARTAANAPESRRLAAAMPGPGANVPVKSPTREIGGWEPSPAGDMAVVDLQDSVSMVGFVDLREAAKTKWVPYASGLPSSRSTSCGWAEDSAIDGPGDPFPAESSRTCVRLGTEPDGTREGISR